jgi:AcrR family transcriptional regulator
MRSQRPRGSTTRIAVVNAALLVADRDGVDGLTMRSVAREVGAPPMSLYAHFKNKNELLDLMYAEIAARMYRDEMHPTWQAEMLALCRRVRGLLAEHPKWIPLLSRPVTPLAIPLRERILKLMVADGMAGTDALRALSSAVLTSMGLVLVESTLTGPDGTSALEARFQRLKEWSESPAGQQDNETRGALAEAPTFELDRVFEVTIGALITGFVAQKGREPRKQEQE